jgi:TrmH family RNA methyltransferase
MNFRKITSPANPFIREAIAVREKRSLYKYDNFVIEGPRVVAMALDAGIIPNKVFFTEEFASKKEGERLLSRLSKKNAEVFEVTDHLLRKLTDTENPQGIAALASYSPMPLDSLGTGETPLVVVVDGVQDPGNLGTIIRTADAAGAGGVVLLPGTCDAFMPKVIRSTAGSIFNLPLSYSTPPDLLKWSGINKISLAVTSADAEKTIFESRLDMPAAFVFGNETRGVSETIRKSADMLLRIPIFGKAESLNVATASAICLYEAVRQRRLKEII